MPAFRPRIRALAVGVGATVAASNPTTLYACYDVYGNVRMGDTAQCKLPGGGRLVNWSTVGVPGPTGATGPTGPAGPTGPTGPAGPGTLITAWVSAGGAVSVSSVPPGATFTAQRLGVGDYFIGVTGLGTGYCPNATYTVAGPTFMWAPMAVCSTGFMQHEVRTGDGADHTFFVTVAGTMANAGGAAAQSLPTTTYSTGNH
jgi:hypothetical protein